MEEKIIEDVKNHLTEYKRLIEEQVLFDVLRMFYFANWTRECDYSKMSSEEVVNAVMDTCRAIENYYKYNFNDDIFDSPFVSEDCNI